MHWLVGWLAVCKIIHKIVYEWVLTLMDLAVPWVLLAPWKQLELAGCSSGQAQLAARGHSTQTKSPEGISQGQLIKCGAEPFKCWSAGEVSNTSAQVLKYLLWCFKINLGPLSRQNRNTDVFPIGLRSGCSTPENNSAYKMLLYPEFLVSIHMFPGQHRVRKKIL